MAADEAEVRFRPLDRAELLVRELAPLTLIYHRRSGVTHMLAEPVPQILDGLARLGEADAATLAGWLADRFDLVADHGAAEAVIASRLVELADLGLVERCGR